jgi:LysR family glycine cleavage system transcriptional activator
MPALPALNSLKAFEAAARHLSFTAAAAELHVTHGAVSRQVAALEEALQVTLFLRGTRRLKLTEEGAQLAAAAASAFTILRSATDRLRRDGPASALRVSVPPTLAMRWLIPRMTALHQAHPRLRIDLSTSTEPVDFGQGAYDAAIRRVRRAPPGLVAERFLDGRSIPVCSPAYRKQCGLRSTADLERATLIVTRSEPAAWSEWLRQFEMRRSPSSQTLTFEQLYFALQAALDSLGVALVPVAVVAAEIQAGRLVPLAQPAGADPSCYALLFPKASAKSEPIRTLANWLKDAAAQAGET